MLTNKKITLVVVGLLIFALAFTGVAFFMNLGISPTAGINTEYTTKLFDKNSVITMDIQVEEKDWTDMLENATAEEYICCDVEINGTLFQDIGIRPKGNSSLNTVASSDSDRYSFKLEFDHYIKNQTCWGLDKFVVNNIQADSTYMKEYLSYDLFQYMGVASPLYAFVNITVNGQDWGLYVAIESLEDSFVQRNYGYDYGNLYKPGNEGARGATGMIGAEELAEENTSPQEEETANNWMEGGRPGGFGGMNGSGGANLVYTDDEISSYPDIFDYAVFDTTTDAEKQRVITALKNIGEGNELEKYVDVDAMLRYIAVNAVLVNLDSYFGSMMHNYYLYEKDGQITMLPWDYNLAFGGFQAGDSSSVINFPIDTPVSGGSLSERPLIGKLLEVEEYKEKYHEYLQEIVDGYFNSGLYEQTIDNTYQLIQDYVQKDATAFCSYEDFENSIDSLKLYGTLRAESIQGQLNGTIGATTEAQAADSSTLVDSSALDLSDLGSMGNSMGGGPGGGQMGNPPEGFENGMQPPNGFDGEFPGNNSESNGNNTMPTPPQNGESETGDSSEFTRPDGLPEGQFGQAGEPPGGFGGDAAGGQRMQPPEGMDAFSQQNGQDSSDSEADQIPEDKMSQRSNRPNDNMEGMEVLGDLSQEDMEKVLEILSGVENDELTEEQTRQLTDLGLSEEQIQQLMAMQNQIGDRNQMPMGGMNLPGRDEQSLQNTESDQKSMIILLVCGILLVGALLFARFFKRRRMSL